MGDTMDAIRGDTMGEIRGDTMSDPHEIPPSKRARIGEATRSPEAQKEEDLFEAQGL